MSLCTGGFVLGVESALFAGFSAALGIRHGHAGAANRQYRLFAGLGLGVWRKRFWFAAAVDGAHQIAALVCGAHAVAVGAAVGVVDVEQQPAQSCGGGGGSADYAADLAAAGNQLLGAAYAGGAGGGLCIRHLELGSLAGGRAFAGYVA